MLSIKEKDSFSKRDTLVVKGIAIIMMVFHHCFMYPAKYKGQRVSFWPFSAENVNIVCLQFKLCVPLFVFLSVYALTLSLRKAEDGHEIKNILVHRYIRTMGGFVFIFVFLQLFSLLTGKGWFTHRYGTGLISGVYMVIDGLGLAYLFDTPRFSSLFWYMSLAQAVIVITPLLYFVYKKTGALPLLILTMILSASFYNFSRHPMAEIPGYIICIGTAIIAADKNILVKSYNFSLFKGHAFILNKLIKLIAGGFLVLFFLNIRYLTMEEMFHPCLDAIMPLMIIAFVFEFVGIIPVISSILAVLGKYSMGIFLVHTLIRRSWYYDVTYSFGNFIEIGCFLLAVSFAVSFVLLNLQRICGYNKLLDKLEKKLTASNAETAT